MKFGPNEIFYINEFEKLTRATAKDCVVEDSRITFVVKEKQLLQAIGKNGETVRKVVQRLGKNIEVFEYSDDPKKFLQKAFYNAKINDVVMGEAEGKKTAEVEVDSENKRKIMHNSGRLKKVKELMKRLYGIEKVRIN
ncbi:MAG: NusA-like transcription termination signal-binding factor [Candidatus Diapherotrites archaeon]